MHIAVEHYEIGALIISDDAATLCEIAHHLLAIALVVDEETQQIAVRGAVPDVEGEARLWARKAAWLNDLRDEVGPDLGDEAAQCARARGRQKDVGEQDDEADDGGERKQGGADAPNGSARGRHHDELAVAVHAVERAE